MAKSKQHAQVKPQSPLDWLMVACAKFGDLTLYSIGTVDAARIVLDTERRRKELTDLAVAGVTMSAVSTIFMSLGRHFVSSPRPFSIKDGAKPNLVPASKDNGFPSNHTLRSATLAAVVYTHNRPLGLSIAGGSFMVGLARVYCRVHHLRDILGGLAIALLALGSYQGGRQLAKNAHLARLATPNPYCIWWQGK